MSYVMVDIEADGPIPGDYSMVCFGAVVGPARQDLQLLFRTPSSLARKFRSSGNAVLDVRA